MLREVFSKRAEARRLSKLREKRKETRKRQPSMILVKHIREIEDRTRRKEITTRPLTLTMIAASMMYRIDLS